MEQLCLCSHPGHSVRQREGRPRWPRTITRRSATRCASSAPGFRAPTGASATSGASTRTRSSEALGEAGYLACLIPEAYGGSGLGLTAAAAILEEIHASGGNGAACHAQMYTMGALLRHGSEAQKERWLPGIARGQLRLQAFGITEPGAGSDTTGIATAAVREGDHYVVTGQKIWTSRAEHSDLMLLLARTTPREQAARRSDGLSLFLVDLRGADGLTIRPIRTMLNHATTEVFLDHVRVPAGNLIGEEGRGFRYLLDAMNAERILIAAECLGDARWFIDKATAYARERVVFGRPIGQNQGVQFPIARAYAASQAAALMVREAGRLFEAECTHAGRRPTWRSCWRPTPPGRRPTSACRPMAASASPPSTMSSASSARPASIRWPRSRPT